MRFIVRQKIFSFGDNFTIKDEYGREHFIVKGKVFSFGDKLRIYDMAGHELYYIEQSYSAYCPNTPFINPASL